MDHAAHRAGGAEPHRRVLSPQAAPAGHASARRAARNTAWNLVGIALPLLAGLATIPILAGALGPARFGILGLAWAVLEYLSLLDAGLGRATVHLVARRLHAPEGLPGDVVAASVLAQAALGAVGGLALALLAPLLATTALDVPAALRAETRAAFLVLAATVPFVLVGVALRGILEAADRFDAAAAVRVPSSTATFVVPALLAVAGASVPTILAALLAVRVAACVATLALIHRCVPALRWARPAAWTRVRPLLTFGGWVAVSNVLSPVFLLLDRLVLGALVGIVAVGFYTGPYEAVVRLLVVPAALATAIFPAMTALAAGDADRARSALRPYYVGAVRTVALPMLALGAVGVVVAPDLLAAWLGPDYAARTALATRLLIVGVAANAIAHVPFAAVQAMGRPDVTARLHLLEAAVHVPVTLLLVARWGIAGAAAAWTLRAVLDAVLVARAAHRMLGASWRDLGAGRGIAGATALVAVGACTAALQAGVAAAGGGTAMLLVGLAAVTAAFTALAWTLLLTDADRAAVRGAVRRRA